MAKAKFKSGHKRLLQYDAEGNVTNNDDLISYAEYVFLLTVLSSACVRVPPARGRRSRAKGSPLCRKPAPKHQYELAFYMFDLDGNGTVDMEEFGKVQQAVQVRLIAAGEGGGKMRR